MGEAASASPQDEVDRMLSAGLPFARIEMHIEDWPLPADAKSALWLYAWVEADRHDRRRAVGELLAGVAHQLRD